MLKNSGKIILASLSGLLITFSFPKISLEWISWFAFIPLLIALKNTCRIKAFYIGAITGFVHYITLLYWLIHTLNIYAFFPFYLSIAVLLLFCAYLSLYFAFFSMLAVLFCKKNILSFIIMPIIFVSLEYIRSFLLSGFPWELIGYSQYKILPLIQIADITGVYGVSFLIILTNVSLLILFLYVTHQDWNGIYINKKSLSYVIIAIIMVFVLVLSYGNYKINNFDYKSPKANIAVIQGNIDQLEKWEALVQISTINKYLRLSNSIKKFKPDLIVFPETAMPFYFSYDLKLSDILINGIKEINTDFLIGSPSFIYDNKKIRYFNTAYLVGSDGKINGKYDKVHLVPFGEYVPSFLPFINKLVEGVAGDFSAGEAGKNIEWGKNKISVQICFEIIFSYLARKSVNNGAQLLFTMTNDAWFGITSAPYQHFSMIVFRAVENRRSVIRSANTGISGFIDPTGKILLQTKIFKEDAITHFVPIMNYKTFYTRFGDFFAAFCLIIILVKFFLNFKNRRKKCLMN